MAEIFRWDAFLCAFYLFLHISKQIFNVLCFNLTNFEDLNKPYIWNLSSNIQNSIFYSSPFRSDHPKINQSRINHKCNSSEQNKKYRDEINSLQIQLSRTQAEPGRAVKEQQEQDSPNHVQRKILSLYFAHKVALQSYFLGCLRV